MKILLIQVDECEGGIFPVHLRPLALECLAAHLQEHEVRLLDLRVDPVPLAEHLARFEPELVGVTCTFTTGLHPTQRVLRAVRQLAPGAKIVVGGVHASSMPGDFRYPLADFLVRGPGERTLAALAQALAAGEDPRQVAGLVLIQPGGLYETGPLPSDYRWSKAYRPPARQLNAANTACYAPGPDGEPMVYLVSSRGCPYRCKFCAAWQLQGGRLDTREARCIYEEVLALAEPWIYFFDDNSLANRKVMRQLASLLAQGEVRKRYQMWVSADILCRERELVQRWREVGLRRVFTGLESVGGSFLARMGKRAGPAQNLQAIQICRELDLALTPTFIIDQSFTPDDFDRLADYVAEHALHLPYFFLLTPLPGTALFAECAPQIIEAHPGRYDLYHLVLPPTKMDPARFLERFVGLYQQCASWQQVARVAGPYRQLLENITGILQAPLVQLPTAGLDPQLAAFPQAA